MASERGMDYAFLNLSIMSFSIYKPTSFLIPLFLSFGLTLGALADDAKDKEWNGGLEIGSTLTDGNSNTERVIFDFDYGYVWEEKNEAIIDANYKYGESDKDKNLDNASVMIQYNRTINENIFGHMEARYEMDDIAQLNHRLVLGLGPGIGYNFVKTKKTEFAAEVGFVWIDENQAGVGDDWVVLRFAERYEHKLTDHSRIYQKLEYLPETDDMEVFLFNFEAGIESGFTKFIALRLSVEDKYNSNPEGDVEKNDFILKGGIVFKL